MTEFDFSTLVHNFILKLQSGVHNFTKKGHCSYCCECCSNLLSLASAEISRILSYVSEHHIKPQVHTKNHFVVDAFCPFLSSERLCTIYDVRPLICKFFECNLKSPTEKHLRLFLKLNDWQLVNVRNTFFNSEANHE